MVQYHRNTLHQMDYAGQLVEAKEAADRANAAKSSFLANMSHEIRTPINAVLGMNEMILRESLQAAAHAPLENGGLRDVLANISACAGNIDSAGNNLLSIINDILDFSRIEAGRMELAEADYKFSSVLSDVSNMVAFKARDKGLDFHVEADPGLPDGLFGDEVRVRQIITNLLNNAVKYTKTGGVTLSVRIAADAPVREGEALRLVIAVRDTGIGIREEDIDRLFTKFERVDLRQNSTVEGTGLGLAITKNLLDRMGGSIRVESEYGKGSVFTVELPQKVVSAEPMGDFREKFEQSIRQAGVYHGAFRAPDARILIVDDTKMNLTVAVGLLKKTEMQIDTAGGGAQAIELARGTRYDLILMDQRMPEMDGTEAMTQIKAQADGANAATPFICLTADAVSGARSRYLAEGFTDYLSKPIDSQALEAMLMKYLPSEKVLPVEEAEDDAAAPDADADDFAPLRAAGLQPEIGLRYCQNDADFYRAVLIEYARSAPEKAESLHASFAAENWKDYAVFVHALKSASKTIGAMEIAELASRLEAAANAGNGEAIRAEHTTLMREYDAAVTAIRAAAPDSDASAAGGGDVLEFLPEDERL
jgi:signal transduction histidine kinase/FixJ family two-component response regulator